LTERLSTGIGIDLRVINGAAVITRVDSGLGRGPLGFAARFVINSAAASRLPL